MDMDQEFDRPQENDRDLTPAEAPEAAVPAEGVTEMPETPSTPQEIQTAPPAPPERHGGKTRLLTGVVAGLVVLALVIVLAGRALAGGSAIQRSAKGLAANPTLAFLSDLCKSGTVSMELGLEELFGFDSVVSMEWRAEYGSAEKTRAAFDMGLLLKGKQVADLSVYADGKQMILSSDALLPEQSLGVDLAHLSENLDKSVFSPESGSDYAMDAQSFATLKNSLAGRGTAEPETLKKQMEQLYGSALKMLHKSIKAHTEQAKDSETLNFGDKTVKVSVRSYQADAEALYEILMDTLEWAKDSQELRSFLDSVWAAYLTSENLPEGNDAIVGIYGIGGAGAAPDPKGLPDDPNAVYAQLYANFWWELDAAYTELKDGREEFLRENDGLELELDAYISKGKGELLGVKLTVEQDRQEKEFEAFWGPSLAELSSVSFKYDDGYNRYSGSYTVKVNNQQSFASELKLREHSHTVFTGGFQWDKKEGGFTLRLGDAVNVKGTLTALQDGYQADVQTVTLQGGTGELDLRLTLRQGADFAAPPAYQEVTAMTEADIEHLLEELQDAAASLLWEQDLGWLLYGLRIAG